MEGTGETTTFTTPSRLPVMADGPIFDMSGLDGITRATPLAMDSAQRVLFFDRGSSPWRESAGLNSGCQVQTGGSHMMDRSQQMSMLSGMRHLMQNPEGSGQLSITMSRSIQARSSTLDAVGLVQMQHMASAGSGLPALPESISPPPATNRFTGQAQNQRHEEFQNDVNSATAIAALSLKLDNFISMVMQRDAAAQAREAAAQGRLEDACQMMQLATSRMNELISAMMQREAELDIRNYNRSLDLRLGCGTAPLEARFNWMFGHGVTPRGTGKATPSQARYARLKVNVKNLALWFTDRASEAELSRVWIQFNDTPRVSLTGYQIREFLLNHEDMSDELESAAIRVLRRDEVHRDVNSSASTHYVGKEWARKVAAGGSTAACEKLFYQEPKIQYSLAGCTKVVVSMDMKQNGWASLLVDLARCITYLIHPNLSGEAQEAVLAHHLSLMQTLTMAAKAHMVKLGKVVLPMKEWEYDVALKTLHHMNGPESGFTTAFYSIPKDNQFMIVSPETIGLAKHTFFYSLVRMSYRCTKLRLPQNKPARDLKRGPNGKFVATTSKKARFTALETGEGTASRSSDAASSA